MSFAKTLLETANQELQDNGFTDTFKKVLTNEENNMLYIAKRGGHQYYIDYQDLFSKIIKLMKTSNGAATQVKSNDLKYNDLASYFKREIFNHFFDLGFSIDGTQHQTDRGVFLYW